MYLMSIEDSSLRKRQSQYSFSAKSYFIAIQAESGQERLTLILSQGAMNLSTLARGEDGSNILRVLGTVEIKIDWQEIQSRFSPFPEDMTSGLGPSSGTQCMSCILEISGSISVTSWDGEKLSIAPESCCLSVVAILS